MGDVTEEAREDEALSIAWALMNGDLHQRAEALGRLRVVLKERGIGPTRLLTDPHFSVDLRGEYRVVVTFRVLGSKFGPVQVELDTGEVLALIEEMEEAVDEADRRAQATVADGEAPATTTPEASPKSSGQGEEPKP